MDVILTEVENGKSKFIFPSLPEEVKERIGPIISPTIFCPMGGKNPKGDEAYRDFI